MERTIKQKEKTTEQKDRTKNLLNNGYKAKSDKVVKQSWIYQEFEKKD